MYSFTYKISLGDGSDKTILDHDNTSINNKTKVESYGKEIICY